VGHRLMLLSPDSGARVTMAGRRPIVLLIGLTIGGHSQTISSAGDSAKPATAKPAVRRPICADQFAERACLALTG
jgi:hypothetical protein